MSYCMSFFCHTYNPHPHWCSRLKAGSQKGTALQLCGRRCDPSDPHCSTELRTQHCLVQRPQLRQLQGGTCYQSLISELLPCILHCPVSMPPRKMCTVACFQQHRIGSRCHWSGADSQRPPRCCTCYPAMNRAPKWSQMKPGHHR